MSWRRVLAITIRIVRQIRRDRRTLALIFLAPIVILSLLGYVYRGSARTITLALSAPDTPFVTAFAQELTALSIRVERVSPEQAIERVRAGQAAGAVLIEPTPSSPMRLVLDGSQPGRARQVSMIASQAAMRTALQQLLPQGTEPSLTLEYVTGSPQFDELDTFAPVFIGFFAFSSCSSSRRSPSCASVCKEALNASLSPHWTGPRSSSGTCSVSPSMPSFNLCL